VIPAFYASYFPCRSEPGPFLPPRAQLAFPPFLLPLQNPFFFFSLQTLLTGRSGSAVYYGHSIPHFTAPFSLRTPKPRPPLHPLRAFFISFIYRDLPNLPTGLKHHSPPSLPVQATQFKCFVDCLQTLCFRAQFTPLPRLSIFGA